MDKRAKIIRARRVRRMKRLGINPQIQSVVETSESPKEDESVVTNDSLEAEETSPKRRRKKSEETEEEKPDHIDGWATGFNDSTANEEDQES